MSECNSSRESPHSIYLTFPGIALIGSTFVSSWRPVPIFVVYVSSKITTLDQQKDLAEAYPPAGLPTQALCNEPSSVQQA